MKKRCIYSYEFDDNCVYVGLTSNYKNRQYKHKKESCSSVFQHNKICSGYTFKLLTEYIDVEDAKIKEGEYVEKYRNDNWTILNKTGTGSIGGNIVIWTYEKCKETALKYNTRCNLKKRVYGLLSKNNTREMVRINWTHG